MSVQRSNSFERVPVPPSDREWGNDVPDMLAGLVDGSGRWLTKRPTSETADKESATAPAV